MSGCMHVPLQSPLTQLSSRHPLATRPPRVQATKQMAVSLQLHQETVENVYPITLHLVLEVGYPDKVAMRSADCGHDAAGAWSYHS